MTQLTKQLSLEPNIEGGYYRQTWEANATVETAHGQRPLANSIFYLLTDDSPIGHFHLNHSDITHFFHKGGPIEYLLVSPSGQLQSVTMGADFAARQVLSFTCPGGWWKSSHLSDGTTYGLISEITVPAFRYEDHQMATPEIFQQLFPDLLEACQKYILK